MDNENNTLKLIGNRIRAIRLERKMSQEDVADIAGTSVSLISDIEHGKSNSRIYTFIRIIEALKVSADEILRADVPGVNGIYQNELSELLKDCTPNETETILTLVKNVKDTFHKN